ncbi:hypothetical protein EB796_018705 [Bugula neritina]|uniref:AK9 n=1 Tax=Bugula neritina TaxID=10212 RepID=A0A7J7JBG3_BUGNE|nr:hypothetical protein EB796_018705 [Bugula neritina]
METAEPGNKPLQFGQGKDLVSHSMDLETLLKQSEKTDCYDDDITELKFLLSNPTCFLVLGKPGSGKTAIARKISQNWHCELVNPTELVLQNMEMGTDIGNKCREMLHRGEAVPEEMVAKMIEDKINSPEVAHHGYVLDGLPSLNEDYMTIKDQLEHIKNFNLKPDFIVHVKEGEQDQPSVLPADTVSRLLVRPEDLPDHVVTNVAHYRSAMLRILEDYMADHSQQHLIELDANQPVNVLEKQILAKLNCFNIRPAAVPIRLANMDEEEGSY